jgi:DNA-binding transcriptional LysR family regulator
VAKGWESELRIAVDTLVGVEKLFRIAAEFYEQGSGTRLRLLHEVLGGTWDSLASGRADLAVGAPAAPPSGRSYETRKLGPVQMVFVAAPFHAICKEPRPLTDENIQHHRAVSIADTSRLLPPRTVGLLSGQDTLSVPTLEAKAAALVAGLGVGFLPRWIAEREALGGRLAILDVAVPGPSADALIAWRPGQEGNALKWFVKRLEDPLVAAELLS